ncbi:SusC/RagA family TonB-linked outer membrane protein [Flavilitoribacter nigricans]|uniref:SusC/RagA family TonB-linked outer membrane protein n=1 Tax=Flavilitoribacter nigricans (strain ATCC 23147 / DSM 23189 / NBRC 102662 / NCIMB 1420 / SS-2) TaxID=1122177 RepID=A0A2D0NBH0_FLAN2|nr:TonB-dependent receptor [Flavilitoribacter nigricans]PHN05710.1 SusC/RagA family TonB-linked outer membrane protein [Flavilitoribacter nigricans DSM 23189 = NBRC 102662]
METKSYLLLWNKRKLFLSLFFWSLTLMSFQLMAQRQISGTITDGSTGEPLIGANILVRGSSSGTVTDFDGSFELNIPDDGSTVLDISYTGYKPMEIAVGSQSVLTLSLDPDFAALEEVVVVGYGTQKKRDVTGSISTLGEEKIGSLPVASGVQAMQGQVAGVDIQSAGGRPGQAPTIKIRGRRSISASNDPLFVIDGIPQTSGTSAITDINPQDIASMEILKDAAATAIYGSRGANGVIIITTKRGKSGKTVVSYDGYYGLTSAITNVDMMNTEQWMNMRREAFRNGYDGSIPSDEEVFQDDHLAGIAAGNDVDWLDLVLKDGFQTNHQLGLRGGSEKTQFNISLGYFDEDGIIDNMDYSRLSGRLNLDHTLNDIFKAGVSFTLSSSTQNWGSSATMGESLGNVPVGFAYQDDGVTPRFLPTNDGIRTNPLNEILPGAFVDERKVTRIFSPLYLQAKITDGLTFTSTFGPDIRFYERGEFRASLTNDNRGGPGDAEIQNATDVGYTLENLLNFTKDIGNSNLGVTFLQSIQSFQNTNHYTAVANLPYESQLFYNIGTASVKGNVASRLTEWKLASFMGRVNYSIAGKYIIQATLRADGSSRLSEGNKWNYFPGLSVGWRLSDEPMFATANWLNNLKLRASYGEVGNTSVNPYQTAGRLTRRVYSFGEANAFGFGLNEIPNPDLTWEVSSTVDVGMDFDVLNGRFSGTLDFYRTNTSDILLARQLPPTSGYTSILQNVGSTQTSGIEFGLTANIIDNPGGFRWSLDWNISSYKEQITELALKDADGNPTDDIGNGWFIGQPIRVWYDYNNIGIYQVDEADLAATAEAKVPGEIKLEDVNGDGIITADDRKIIGTDVPDFFGGLTTRFEYKGFDLSAFLYYRQGQTIFSNFHVGNNSLFARYNNLNVDYWSINNPGGTFPRPNQNQERPRNNSTMGYFDGSYVKLRNVTLGYNLPSSALENVGISSLRFYVSGQNLWFAAKYDTFDPEVDDPDTGDLPSLGAGTTPSTKIFLFGVKAQF